MSVAPQVDQRFGNVLRVLEPVGFLRGFVRSHGTGGIALLALSYVFLAGSIFCAVPLSILFARAAGRREVQRIDVLFGMVLLWTAYFVAVYLLWYRNRIILHERGFVLRTGWRTRAVLYSDVGEVRNGREMPAWMVSIRRFRDSLLSVYRVIPNPGARFWTRVDQHTVSMAYSKAIVLHLRDGTTLPIPALAAVYGDCGAYIFVESVKDSITPLPSPSANSKSPVPVLRPL